MTIAMLLGLASMPANAVTISDNLSSNMDIATAQRYAYLSLDDAGPELRTKILEAREIIIYSKAWIADGAGTLTITRADGTTETVPTFSEQFPGWDMPAPKIYKTEENDSAGNAASTASVDKVVQVALKNPSPTANTPAYGWVTQDGSYIRITVQRLIGSAHCNIGYSRIVAFGPGYAYHEPLYYTGPLRVGDSHLFNTTAYSPFVCGLRASTSDVPGSGLFRIQSDSNIDDAFQHQ